MSTLITEKSTACGLLDDLQQSLHRSHPPLGRLIIAHDDDALAGRLAPARDESAAMLRVPQQSWETRDSGIRQAVRWAVCEASVQQLMFVGHSQAVVTGDSSSSPQSGSAPLGGRSSQLSYRRLVDGALRLREETERSKMHFASQIGTLCEMEELQNALRSGRTRLHPLFYMSPNGTFLLFDIMNQSFTPLDNYRG